MISGQALDSALIEAFERGEGFAELTYRGVDARLINAAVINHQQTIRADHPVMEEWRRANQRTRPDAPREGDRLFHVVLVLAYEDSPRKILDFAERLGIPRGTAKHYREEALRRLAEDPPLRDRLTPLADQVRAQLARNIG